MKKLLIVSVFTFSFISLFGQGNFFIKNNHIEKWYVSKDEKMSSEFSRVAAFAEFQEALKTQQATFAEVKKDFHFLDFDHDGRLDIIFNGKIQNQHYVFLFLNRGENYHLSFANKGVLYAANEPNDDNLLNFSLYVHACCGNLVNKNIQYVCVKTNNTAYFNEASTGLIFKGTFLPSLRFAPVSFHVTNSAYVRIEPRIDNEKFIAGKTSWRGNFVGLYPKGATGTILAETKDEKGNFWYFVRMDNSSGTKIHSDRFEVSKEVEDANTCFYYGWLKHEDITFD